MTKKVFKLLLSVQGKSACWFIGIYALIMAILIIIFSYITIDDVSWIPLSILYAPKIYLLVMGIVYPLVSTKLYVSKGVTRTQFFWAYTGAISVISLLLLIPILVSSIYNNDISISMAITHYLQMPLFFLIGWTSIVGFQLKKWNMVMLGILSAIAMFHLVTTMPEILSLPNLATLGIVLLLLIAVLFTLPRIISQVPLQN